MQLASSSIKLTNDDQTQHSSILLTNQHKPYLSQVHQAIKSSSNHPIIMACTNQTCLAYPFICTSTKQCTKCEQSHQHCMTFIRFQKLLNQINRKKRRPTQVINFLQETFNRWIDMISDMLDQSQIVLDSYGLTKKQEQLLAKVQNKDQQKITGSLLSDILKQLNDQQKFSNTQSELLTQLKKQTLAQTQHLQTQLKNISQVINLARQGKLIHHIQKLSNLSHNWKFDKSYKYASDFLFDQNDETIIKSQQKGRYSHVIGTKKFDSQKVTQFSVFIKQSTQNCIMFGIGTKNIQRQDPHYSKEGVFYWSNNGSIWQKGSTYRAGDNLRAGDIVTIRVEPEHKRVTWLKNNIILAYYSLSQYLLGNQLYPVFACLGNGDKLTIFQDQDKK